MSQTFTIPPHYRLPMDTPEELAEAIRITIGSGSPSEFNPIPPAQRSAGIVLADPEIAAQAEAYALANGGRVIPFMGFRFVVVNPEERVQWVLRLIGRLEHERKAREREAKPA